MKVNHINLTVSDVVATQELLVSYFGLRPIDAAKANQGFSALFDDDNSVITLIKAGKKEELRYPSTFHIGFIQPSEEKVNEINARLRQDGYEVDPPQRLHGSWTFYFTAPGGFVIEVLA